MSSPFKQENLAEHQPALLPALPGLPVPEFEEQHAQQEWFVLTAGLSPRKIVTAISAEAATFLLSELTRSCKSYFNRNSQSCSNYMFFA